MNTPNTLSKPQWDREARFCALQLGKGILGAEDLDEQQLSDAYYAGKTPQEAVKDQVLGPLLPGFEPH